MKNILYILSVVLIFAAAFFAFDTKRKLDGEIAKYDEVYAETETVAAKLEKKEIEKKDLIAAVEEAAKTEAEFRSTKDNEMSKAEGSNRSIKAFNVEIEDYEAELVKFDELLASAKEQLGTVGEGLTFDELPGVIEDAKSDRSAKQKKLEVLEANGTKLDREVASNKSEVVDLRKRLADLRLKIKRNSQQGVVTAVNPTWGFVVVNQGSENSNVSEDSELLVSRNGRLIGRLKVTSLEPNQALCDIDANSFHPGARIQPGDRVTLKNTSVN